MADGFFGDAQEPSARIFLEHQDERFALDLDLSGLEGVFDDGRFGLSIRRIIMPVTIGRGSFV